MMVTLGELHASNCRTVGDVVIPRITQKQTETPRECDVHTRRRRRQRRRQQQQQQQGGAEGSVGWPLLSGVSAAILLCMCLVVLEPASVGATPTRPQVPHRKKTLDQRMFTISSLEKQQHLAGGVAWGDPRENTECRNALVAHYKRRHGQNADLEQVYKRSMFHQFGLATVTKEVEVGGEICVDSGEFLNNQWAIPGSEGRVIYKRNLKAASTTLVHWLEATRTHLMKSNPWPIALAPLTMTTVRHPLSRFASVVGTAWTYTERHGGPFTYTGDSDWYRVGGYAEAILDVLESMGQPDTNHFQRLMRENPRIIRHAYSQMWYLTLEPCDAYENTKFRMNHTSATIDAVLRTEVLPKDLAEMRTHPGWEGVLPVSNPPWFNKEEGRGKRTENKNNSNTAVHIPCWIAARVYNYYYQDFVCFNYTMPQECG